MCQQDNLNCNSKVEDLLIITKHQNELLSWEKQKSEILTEIAEKLLLSPNPLEIVQELCEKVMEFLHCSTFFHYLLDEDKSRLHLNAYSGIPSDTAKEIKWIDYGVAVCGCVAQDGHSIVAENIQIISNDKTEFVKSLGIRAYACYPLIARNKVIGTLSFGTKYKDTLSEEELSLMRAVSNFVAVAMTRIEAEQIIIKQQKLLLASEREMNEALKKAIEIKDEFLSLVSHELRTPINVISAAIQTLYLLYGNQLTNKVREYLTTIRRNNFRQLRLVNNILDITRAEAGNIKINKKNVDIVFLTRSITESIQIFADQKGVKLGFTSTCKKKVIGIDEEKYERILLNLLSNAVKFTQADNQVNVKLHCFKNWVSIEVKDDGLGIPTDKLDMIFERFGQVDSTLSRPTEGAGIGLYLTKRFVDSLGGKILVESRLNFGSTFTLLLPSDKVVEDDNESGRTQFIKNDLVEIANVEFSDIYL